MPTDKRILDVAALYVMKEFVENCEEGGWKYMEEIAPFFTEEGYQDDDAMFKTDDEFMAFASENRAALDSAIEHLEALRNQAFAGVWSSWGFIRQEPTAGKAFTCGEAVLMFAEEWAKNEGWEHEETWEFGLDEAHKYGFGDKDVYASGRYQVWRDDHDDLIDIARALFCQAADNAFRAVYLQHGHEYVRKFSTDDENLKYYQETILPALPHLREFIDSDAGVALENLIP